MSVPVAHGLTYDDLQAFPDDHLRREIIDGELYVSPAPVLRHQHAVACLTAAFFAYTKEHGGRVYPAPTDVYFAHDTVVEPDVVFIGSERAAQLRDPRYLDIAPDLAVEVSSPSTRRLDLIKKRALFEREAVPEFWFVDLDADQVEVHRLDSRGRYGSPTRAARGDMLTCEGAPGLAIAVDDILAG